MNMESRSNRVLILAPTGKDDNVLKEVLANEQIAVSVCESMEQLCRKILEGAGTAIISEEALYGDALIQLAHTIDHQPEWSDFPVIIMAGVGSDPDMTWAVLSGGKTLNASVLKRPVLIKSLLTVVRACLRSRNQQYRIVEELIKRKKAEEQMSQSEQRYRLLFENISEGFVLGEMIWDDKGNSLDWRFLEVNKAWAQTGIAVNETVGRTVREVNPHIETQWIETCGRVVKTGESVFYENYDSVFGKWFANLAFKHSGDCFGLLFFDITERKKAEQALLQRTEELAATNRDLESFSYSVSHDLRNPLHTIGGFAQFLFEDYSEFLDEVGRDYLRRINDGVNQMQQIINDMLNLSRIGRQEMKRENVDLSAIVLNYLQEFKNTEPERLTEFNVKKNVHANADPRMINLALENLLRNAWKFTKKTEITRIEFGTIVRDEQIVYFVIDNGAGFDMQFSGAIFEPFKRVHAEKEFGGTGVGLSIVQRVIRKHGGKVWAEGKPGKGAVFYFTIE